jgi:hypothetical protein
MMMMSVFLVDIKRNKGDKETRLFVFNKNNSLKPVWLSSWYKRGRKGKNCNGSVNSVQDTIYGSSIARPYKKRNWAK